VFQNRVQMADNLIKKKWKGENKCKLCLKDESVDHLNFICHLSIFVLSVIKEGLKWEKIPRTVKEFIDECLLEGEGGGIKITVCCFLLSGRCVGQYGLIEMILYLETS
jgi:hypothetical protein